MYTDTRSTKPASPVVAQGIKPGDPATVFFAGRWSRAMVVTKVTPKTVVLARVETGPEEPDMACDVGVYGSRPMVAHGILDKIIPGTEERYTWSADRKRFVHGSSRASFGSSVQWIDHRI